jgi:hypothetical protein
MGHPEEPELRLSDGELSDISSLWGLTGGLTLDNRMVKTLKRR